MHEDDCEMFKHFEKEMKKLDPNIKFDKNVICCCNHNEEGDEVLAHNEAMKFKIDFTDKEKYQFNVLFS